MGKNKIVRATNPKLVVRDNKIANDRVSGMTYLELAKQYNISKTRVNQILSKPGIKDVIDTGTNQMISMIPLACQVQCDTMQGDNAALALKASELVLKTGGIIPSNVTNQTVNAVFNMQNNITLSPGVAATLANISMQDDPDVTIKK